MKSSKRGLAPVYWVFGGMLAVGMVMLISGAIYVLVLAEDNTQEAISLPTPTDTPTIEIVAVEPSATSSQTHTPIPKASGTATVTASPTEIFTPTDTETPTATFTASATSTLTATPTPTATYTATYTPTATATPTIYNSPTPTTTPFAGAVEAVPTNGYDLTNILLIGVDRRNGQRDFRTDVLVIVSINHTTGTVNMLSLPRDLFVYIPTYGWDRVNTATVWGTARGFPGGGVALLRETLRYNLGISIDHYAMVNFDGFAQIIDALNGIYLVVDCALSDYRLKSPTSNPNLFSSYEWIDLDVGLYKMSGANALWYARSRSTTSDFDRNQRHQRLLIAIWNRFNQLDLWQSVPQLWEGAREVVETDMALDDILRLVPMGITINPSLIERHVIDRRQVYDYTTPGGAAVLKMNPDAVRTEMENFLTPPTLNRLYQEAPRVEVINQSTRPNLDIVAVAILNDIGFNPVIGKFDAEKPRITTGVYDYTGTTKGSSLPILTSLFQVPDEDVQIEPDPDRTYDFRIVIGDNFNSCIRAPLRG